MWHPKEPDFTHLDAVDPDVEPVDARRADLGVPDAAWWFAAVVATFGAGMALLSGLAPRLGLAVAQPIFAGWVFAGWTFAGARWGHRRYQLGRALRDAAKPLALGLVVALLAALFIRLGWPVPGGR